MFSLKKSVMSFDVYLHIFRTVTKPATANRFLYMPSTRNVADPYYSSNLPFGIMKYSTTAIFRFPKWSSTRVLYACTTCTRSSFFAMEFGMTVYRTDPVFDTRRSDS